MFNHKSAYQFHKAHKEHEFVETCFYCNDDLFELEVIENRKDTKKAKELLETLNKIEQEKNNG